jgi:hypothetical protein
MVAGIDALYREVLGQQVRPADTEAKVTPR